MTDSLMAEVASSDTDSADVIDGISAPVWHALVGLGRPDLALAPVTKNSAHEHALDADSWDRLMKAIERERISGLLWAAVQAGFPVTPLQKVDLATAHHQAMVNVARMEATADWVVQQLQSAAIDVRLIKGLATAHLVHPSPEHRNSGDIDLLVAPSQFGEACEVLERVGLEMNSRWGTAGNAFAKENMFLVDNDFEIDLHQSLAFGRRWRDLTPRLMEDGLSVGDERRGVTTLSMEALLISACVSAARSDRRVSGLMDVAAISHDERLDHRRLERLVRATGIAPVLNPVLARTSAMLAANTLVVDRLAAIDTSLLDRTASKVELADGGARCLYSCLSAPPRTWASGIRTLVAPENSERSAADNVRRMLDRATELVRPSMYRA